MRHLFAGTLGLLFVISCGEGESATDVPAVLDATRVKRHCDMSADPANLPDAVCRERVDPPSHFDTYCQAANGVARDGNCPHTGALMGCIHADGMELDWYYQGAKAHASRLCFLSSGTLISP